MSNFACEKCGKICYDTPNGYITGCEHYPADLPEGKIVEWLEEELDFCKKKYKSVVEDYEDLPLPMAELREAFWYSGRMDTCERLLKFIFKELTHD